MKPENAHFKNLEFYRENECKNLSHVLDFARCLENTAYPVLKSFYGWDKSEEEPLPSADKMKTFPVFDPTQKGENNIMTGWMMATLGLPYITAVLIWISTAMLTRLKYILIWADVLI